MSRKKSGVECFLEGENHIFIILFYFRLIMTVSSLARRSSFCHFWTLLKNRCRRRAFCGWIGATHQCQFKKEVAEPSKIQMFMPSNHWSFCHLAKRSLHASPRHFQEIMLTSERYGVQRLPFAQVSSSDISFFEQLMPGRVITDTDELNFFNVDWLKSVRGRLISNYHRFEELQL